MKLLILYLLGMYSFLVQRYFSLTAACLVVALLAPNISLAFVGSPEGRSGGSDNAPGPGGNPAGWGGDIGGGNPDAGIGGGSDTGAADAANAESAAAAEAMSADAASVGVSVEPTKDGTGNVSLGGRDMSVADAQAAIGALGAATRGGQVSPAAVGVSAEATIAGYANGTVTDGQVVGATTGVVGTPAAVADVEAHAQIGRGTVSSLGRGISQNTIGKTNEVTGISFNASPLSRDVDFTTNFTNTPAAVSPTVNLGFSKTPPGVSISPPGTMASPLGASPIGEVTVENTPPVQGAPVSLSYNIGVRAPNVTTDPKTGNTVVGVVDPTGNKASAIADARERAATARSFNKDALARGQISRAEYDTRAAQVTAALNASFASITGVGIKGVNGLSVNFSVNASQKGTVPAGSISIGVDKNGNLAGKVSDPATGQTRGMSQAEVDATLNSLDKNPEPVTGKESPTFGDVIAEGIEVDIDPSIGQQPTGQAPSGQQPTGQAPSGQQPSGNQPSGQQPSGQQPSGNQPSGQQPSGNQPSGQQPSGQQPSGQQQGSPNQEPGGGSEPTANRQPTGESGNPGQQGQFDQGQIVNNERAFTTPGNVRDDRTLVERFLSYLFDIKVQSATTPPQTPATQQPSSQSPSGQQSSGQQVQNNSVQPPLDIPSLTPDDIERMRSSFNGNQQQASAQPTSLPRENVDIPNSITRADSSQGLTNAQSTAAGLKSYSQADISHLARTIAGEWDAQIRDYFTKNFNSSGITGALNSMPPSNIKSVAGIVNVIVNRVNPNVSSRNTVEKAVKANAIVNGKTVYQFSTYNSSAKALGDKVYADNKDALEALAKALTDGTVAKNYGYAAAAPVPNATHYHAVYVSPSWAKSLTKLQTYGAHTFYTVEGTPYSVSQVDSTMLAQGEQVNVAIPTARPDNPNDASEDAKVVQVVHTSATGKSENGDESEVDDSTASLPPAQNTRSVLPNGKVALCDCVDDDPANFGPSRPDPVDAEYTQKLNKALTSLQTKYPGLKAAIFSGRHTDPSRDPAKSSGNGSGRHRNGLGGDTYFTMPGIKGQVTDINILADIVQTIAGVDSKSGVGWSARSGTISHVDFEPDPDNNYHGTWSYGAGKNPTLQRAWERGARGEQVQGAIDLDQIDENTLGDKPAESASQPTPNTQERGARTRAMLSGGVVDNQSRGEQESEDTESDESAKFSINDVVNLGTIPGETTDLDKAIQGIKDAVKPTSQPPAGQSPSSQQKAGQTPSEQSGQGNGTTNGDGPETTNQSGQNDSEQPPLDLPSLSPEDIENLRAAANANEEAEEQALERSNSEVTDPNTVPGSSSNQGEESDEQIQRARGEGSTEQENNNVGSATPNNGETEGSGSGNTDGSGNSDSKSKVAVLFAPLGGDFQGTMKSLAEDLREKGVEVIEVGDNDREARAALERVRAMDPDVEVSIVGYSRGVFRGVAMANELARDNRNVEYFGAVDGHWTGRSAAKVGTNVKNFTDFRPGAKAAPAVAIARSIFTAGIVGSWADRYGSRAFASENNTETNYSEVRTGAVGHYDAMRDSDMRNAIAGEIAGNNSSDGSSDATATPSSAESAETAGEENTGTNPNRGKTTAELDSFTYNWVTGQVDFSGRTTMTTNIDTENEVTINGNIEKGSVSQDGTTEVTSEEGINFESATVKASNIGRFGIDKDGNISFSGTERGVTVEVEGTTYSNVASGRVNADGTASFTGTKDGITIARGSESRFLGNVRDANISQIDVDRNGKVTAKGGFAGFLSGLGIGLSSSQTRGLAATISAVSKQALSLSKSLAGSFQSNTGEETNETEIADNETDTEQATEAEDDSTASISQPPVAEYDADTDSAARDAEQMGIAVDHEATAAARADGMPSTNVVGVDGRSYNVGTGYSPSIDAATQAVEAMGYSVDYAATTAARADGLPSTNVIGVDGVTYNTGVEYTGTISENTENDVVSQTGTEETDSQDDATASTEAESSDETDFSVPSVYAATRSALEAAYDARDKATTENEKAAISETINAMININEQLTQIAQLEAKGKVAEAKAVRSSVIDAINALNTGRSTDSTTATENIAETNEDDDSTATVNNEQKSPTGLADKSKSVVGQAVALAGKLFGARDYVADRITGEGNQPFIRYMSDTWREFFVNSKAIISDKVTGREDTCNMSPSICAGVNITRDLFASVLLPENDTDEFTSLTTSNYTADTGIANTLSNSNQNIRIVNVAVDINTGIADFSYIYNSEFRELSLEENLEELLSEESDEMFNESIVIDNGKVVYSDGTFAPVTINGKAVESADDPMYLYVFQYYEDGQLVTFDDNFDDLESGNAVGWLQNLFLDSSPFSFSDVSRVTRQYNEPDEFVDGDEFYDYLILLNDGTFRTIALPEFTSIQVMKKQFSSIGYSGNVLELLSIAETTAKVDQKSRIEKVVESLYQSVSSLFSIFKTGPTEEAYTQLPISLPTEDGILGLNDVKAVTAYINLDADCPNIVGLDNAYLYEIVIDAQSISGSDFDVTIRSPRCGVGDKIEYAAAISDHMQGALGFENVDLEELYNMLMFADLNNIQGGLYTNIDLTNQAPVFQEDFVSTSNQSEGTDAQPNVPNTTNTIRFEVRATDDSGSILADWVYGDLEINSAVDLDFRWDASEYEQCLPFFADDGNYALTRSSNTAMLTGNTDNEGYNIIERTGTYRIECGGQRNGEFGVDAREIEVILR